MAADFSLSDNTCSFPDNDNVGEGERATFVQTAASQRRASIARKMGSRSWTPTAGAVAMERYIASQRYPAGVMGEDWPLCLAGVPEDIRG